MARRRHTDKTCPACQQLLTRVRRLDADRDQHDASTGAPLHRYRCGNLACGWQGLLPARRRRRSSLAEAADAGATATATADATAPARVARPPRGDTAARSAGLASLQLPWARMGGVALTGSLVVLVGVQGARVLLGADRQPDAARAAPPARVAAGVSHDGEDLPARHPWVQPVVLDGATQARLQAVAADVAASAPATVPPQAVPARPRVVAPLSMRRNCSWGQPGRLPYQGTVEQALLHARLPPEVVAEVSQRAARRQVSDRVTIRNDGIRGQRHGHEFDPQRVALTFGHTLCLNSRVNFVAGHEEQADLYEVADRQGRVHAVMVPDVCGNVSVLGQRGERRKTLAAGNSDAHATLLVAADDPETQAWQLLATGMAPGEAATVPEPGSLATLLAAALAWAGVAGWRRRRAVSGGRGAVAARAAAPAPLSRRD